MQSLAPLIEATVRRISIQSGSLSNRTLLVNNLLDLALYAGNKVVSAVGMKPPHDGRSRVRPPRICARSGSAATSFVAVRCHNFGLIEVLSNVLETDLATSPMRHLSVWVVELIKLLTGRRPHPLLTQCPICQRAVHLHVLLAFRLCPRAAKRLCLLCLALPHRPLMNRRPILAISASSISRSRCRRLRCFRPCF
jgi:hypothetical protein